MKVAVVSFISFHFFIFRFGCFIYKGFSKHISTHTRTLKDHC